MRRGHVSGGEIVGVARHTEVVVCETPGQADRERRVCRECEAAEDRVFAVVVVRCEPIVLTVLAGAITGDGSGRLGERSKSVHEASSAARDVQLSTILFAA